jgi:hypothetical protein
LIGDATLNNPKTIASLITDSFDISPEQLLRQFISNNNNIYYESFSTFCKEQNVIVEYYEFLDLLNSDKLYMFHEYSDKDGNYWIPAITEGYVLNILPGDWDDFGDDQIDGITKPAISDDGQQQPIDFSPLTNAQISDDPENTTQIPDSNIEEPDLPDFDTRIRHRPSRSVKELEGRKADIRLIEHQDINGSIMPKLYKLVDSWRNGAIDQSLFEQELHKLSSEPTLKNSEIKIWPMVQKILEVRDGR